MTPARSLAATVLAAVAVALGGCETFTEADPAAHEPVLAVNVVFEAGVPWSVVVYRTVAYGDPTDPADAVVTNAEVVVTDGTTDLPLPHVGAGRYGAAPVPFEGARSLDDPLYEDGPAPVAGRAYALRVAAPGFPTLTATSRAPAAPAVAVGAADVAPGGPARLDVSVTPAGAGTELLFVTDVPQGDGAPGPILPRVFTTTARVLDEATFLDDLQDGASSDRYVSAFLDLPASSPSAFEVVGFRPGPEVVGVHALAASDEYLALRRAEARARAAGRNPFAEPVPPYTNVTGGAGAFAGTTRARAVVERSGQRRGGVGESPRRAL